MASGISARSRVVGGGFGRQDIHWIQSGQVRREEDVVDAVLARHIHTLWADLRWVDAGPGVGVHAVDQLIRLLVVPQVIVTHGNHVGLILRAGNQGLGESQHGRVGAIGMDVVDGEGQACHLDLGFGHTGLVFIAVHECRAGVLKGEF